MWGHYPFYKRRLIKPLFIPAVAPNITADVRSIEAVEGTSRQIDCLVEAFPSPNPSYWVKEADSSREGMNQKVLEQRWERSTMESRSLIVIFRRFLLANSEKFQILEKKLSSYKTRMILTINNLSQQDGTQ